MGLLNWFRSWTKQKPVTEACAAADHVTDLGAVEAGGFEISATLTRYEGGASRSDRQAGDGWQMFHVPALPTVQIHYQQQYRGRPDFRTVVYDLTVERVDTAAFGAYRLMGCARSGGKSYAGKLFPGNRIELIADEHGEIIDDIDSWIASLAVPTPERVQFEKAQGVALAFDPPVTLLLEWCASEGGDSDRYSAEVTDADWRHEDLGCRLVAQVRRIPSYPGQRAWSGRKTFYASHIIRASESADGVEIEDLWSWLLERQA